VTSTVPSGTNLGVAFSGWVDPSTAISSSSTVKNSLPSPQYISLGGGNSNGAWTSALLSTVQSAISSGSFSSYQGIVFDIETGDSGLSSAFQAAFSAANAKGLKVLVTISHSAPYDIGDASTLMSNFFSDSNINYISPQLYSTGSETSNDYSTSGGVAWSAYVGCKAKVVPSIVRASYYSSAKSYFAGIGITTAGYIKWAQS